MKLGIVTYNIAAEWDLATVIANCEKAGLVGVELRTTHSHGVELELSAPERADVRRRFAESPVELVGLGSVYEYQGPEAEDILRNVEGTKAYIELAAEVGAVGVKVRPNFFPEGVEKAETIRRIGEALGELGPFAADRGIELRLEVHGRGTCHPPYAREMLDIADHSSVKACWNCNQADKDESGAIDAHFGMLADRIGLIHTHELWDDYPYARLFELLKGAGYEGYCLAEIPASLDAERVLKYYRAAFEAMVAGS